MVAHFRNLPTTYLIWLSIFVLTVPSVVQASAGMDVSSGGSFSRSSVAYFSTDNLSLSEYANDTRRLASFLSASQPDGTTVTTAYRAWAVTSDGVFGIKASDNTKVGWSADGSTWQDVTISGGNGGLVSVIHSTSDGHLLVWQVSAGGEQPYYGAFNMGTATLTLTLAGGGTWSGYPAYWNVAEHSGTILASTYFNTGAALTGVTYSEPSGVPTLTKTDSFANYSELVGKYIQITGGTGATTGPYTVATASSDDSITLTTGLGAGAVGQTNITVETMINQIWRSTDGGQNWTKVFETTNNDFLHFHAIVYHAGTGKWYQDTGDGTTAKIYTIATTTDIFTTSTAHGWGTGQVVYLISSSNGVAPVGASFGTAYYARVLSATTLTLHPTKADAIADTNKVDITTDGTGSGRSLVAYKQFFLVSDDDGITWKDWKTASTTISTKSPFAQLTRMRDYGDATKIIVGSDGSLRFGWADLTTWQAGTLLKPATSDLNGANYFFDVFQYGGLWYGLLFSDVTAGTHTPAIYVSQDLGNWAIYHRFTTGSVDGLPYFLGYFNGKLHFQQYNDSGSYGHFAISPAKISLKTGVELTPAKTNAASAAVSAASSATGWQYFDAGTGDTYGLDTGTDFVSYTGQSAGSIHVKNINSFGFTTTLYTPAITTSAGTVYVPHAWVKRGTQSGSAISVAANNLSVTTGLRETGWTEIWGKPFTAGASHQISFLMEADRDSGISEFWVDGVELVPVPFSGDWSRGGEAQAAESLTFTETLPDEWTHVFTVQSLPTTAEMGTSALYLATYQLDSDDYVELSYNPSTQRFQLQSTDAGVAGTAITSGTRWLQRGAMTRVSVRYDHGVFDLAISDGQAMETLSSTITRATSNDLAGAGRTIKFAKHDGTSVWPGIYGDSQLFDGRLSDSQLAVGLNQADWADSVAPSVSLSASSTISGATVSLAATASDSYTGLASVSFMTDASTTVAADTSSPFTATLDSTTLSNGGHTLQAVALDNAGNYATSSVSVTVDNAGPVRSNGQPVNRQALTSGHASLSLQTDESATCRYGSVAETSYNDLSGTFTSDDGLNHTALVNLTQSGNYRYYVRCADEQGNQNTADYEIAFNVYPPESISGIVRPVAPAATVSSNQQLLSLCQQLLGLLMRAVQLLEAQKASGV